MCVCVFVGTSSCKYETGCGIKDVGVLVFLSNLLKSSHRVCFLLVCICATFPTCYLMLPWLPLWHLASMLQLMVSMGLSLSRVCV